MQIIKSSLDLSSVEHLTTKMVAKIDLAILITKNKFILTKEIS